MFASAPRNKNERELSPAWFRALSLRRRLADCEEKKQLINSPAHFVKIEERVSRTKGETSEAERNGRRSDSIYMENSLISIKKTF